MTLYDEKTYSPWESQSDPLSTWASQNSQAVKFKVKLKPSSKAPNGTQEWFRMHYTSITLRLPATSSSCTTLPSPRPHCSPRPSNETLMMVTTIKMMATTMMMTTMYVVCMVERVVPVLSCRYQVLQTRDVYISTPTFICCFRKSLKAGRGGGVISDPKNFIADFLYSEQYILVLYFDPLFWL